MKISEFRKLIREEVRKVIKEANVTMSGDYNDSDFTGSAKNAAKAYLKTPEGMNAVKIFKTLTASSFDASRLERAIKAGKFKSMNDFKAAAMAGGLDLEGMGQDNQGNGTFVVNNDNYTDTGVAIAFMHNKFYSVG